MRTSDLEPGVAELVAEAQRGDLRSQEKLVEQFQNRIAGFVFAMLGRDQEVEDVAQDIFIKMLHALPSLRDPALFSVWLFRIARNVCLTHLRRRQLRSIFLPFLPAHEEAGAVAPPDPDPDLVWLFQAIQQLPARQRELIVLLQEGDFSHEELARITHSTVGAIKSRLFRARETLHQRKNHASRKFNITALAFALL